MMLTVDNHMPWCVSTVKGDPWPFYRFKDRNGAEQFAALLGWIVYHEDEQRVRKGGDA